MAWEEPRKTGMAYRRLGMKHGIPVAGETPSSDAIQATRVCMCPYLGWEDGSRTYSQAMAQMEVASGMC